MLCIPEELEILYIFMYFSHITSWWNACQGRKWRQKEKSGQINLEVSYGCLRWSLKASFLGMLMLKSVKDSYGCIYWSLKQRSHYSESRLYCHMYLIPSGAHCTYWLGMVADSSIRITSRTTTYIPKEDFHYFFEFWFSLFITLLSRVQSVSKYRSLFDTGPQNR